MHHILGGVLIGAIFGTVSRRRLRPYLRTAVKGGIMVGRKAQQLGESVRKDVKDLVAEARTDLDTPPAGAAG
jgi:hypothetical protein